MRGSQALHPAQYAALLCFSCTALCASSLRETANANQIETCAVVTKDLRSQIEEIKRLNRAPASTVTRVEKHPKESPRAIAARNRVEADALNDMLPGMGCKRLDIDQELKAPPDPSLLPPASSARATHNKK